MDGTSASIHYDINDVEGSVVTACLTEDNGNGAPVAARVKHEPREEQIVGGVDIGYAVPYGDIDIDKTDIKVECEKNVAARCFLPTNRKQGTLLTETLDTPVKGSVETDCLTEGIDNEALLMAARVKNEPAEEEIGYAVHYGDIDIDETDIKVECETNTTVMARCFSPTNEKQDPCPTEALDKPLRAKNPIDIHERMGKKSFKCNICMKNVSSGPALMSHKRIHSVKIPFECNVCMKKFKRASYLRIHERIHSGEKPFECNVCMKKFIDRSTLTRHKRIHSGLKPFECNVCMKKFIDRSNLTKHKRIHSGLKPFECNVCTKKFRDESVLTSHKRIIHSGRKPFECNVCMKKFYHGSTLILHERIHSGEKPFECNVCMKKFRLRSHLNIHERVHNGEKPFECNVCMKKFIEGSALTNHKRIHSGDKPFECNICMKKFNHSGNFTKHKRTHSVEKPSNSRQKFGQ